MNRRLQRLLGITLLAVSCPVLAQESFRVELGRDGETIGDMRPVFLEFKTQPMPAISPVEVARRYQKLFDSSGEPEVRIDALARLSNIQRFTDQDVSISQEDEQRIYREAIESYDAVINRGSYHGKLDELLYQMAKAQSFIGQVDASTDRLKQLVGLYPRSELVPEARFRIAEAAFSAGNYTSAEEEYSRLISGEGGDALKTKARYMLGWSQYKQGPTAWRRAAVSFLTVLNGLSNNTDQFTNVSKADAGVIEDTFRIVALMAAEADGVESIAAWSQDVSGDARIESFNELLYDRLADLYATKGRYAESVAVGKAFVNRYPEHPTVPAFYAQSVDVWRMAGRPDSIREAQADYVAAFSASDQYSGLTADDQAQWITFTKKLADYHYDQGESAGGEFRGSYFRKAAEYYAQLAPRESAPGETLRLEGDAWLQAGQHDQALAAYEKAAYQAPDYEGAADAGWAALTLKRESVDAQNSLGVSLSQLADSTEKWVAAFPNDPRAPKINSNVANRLVAEQNYERARSFAQSAIGHTSVSAAVTYSSFLVLGETYVADQSYGLAENTWRKALTLASSGTLENASEDDAERIRRQLAASIYQQGEQASDAGKTDIAVAHFQRIDSVLPGSDIAIKGRFDAANTLLKGERWLAAVNELSRFREDFPNNKLSDSISEKLVYAYTSAGKPERAADELMQGSPSVESQVRAASLYHEADAIDKRNAIYVSYLDQSPEALRPEQASDHVQQQTMRHRLIESGIAGDQHRVAMIEAELNSQWHTDETLVRAGQAAMDLGQIQANRFAAVELRAPLAKSLERKQAFLESARARYAQAEQLAGEALLSQSTYRRAELYRQMAQSLMASEAPSELNEMETMQYQMLLEEEAYPFEEKAIALHEQNHKRVASGVFDQWIEQSMQVLARLFPGRYDRSVRWMSWNEGASDDA